MSLTPSATSRAYFGGRKPTGWCSTRDGTPAHIKATIRVVRDASALDGEGLVLEVDSVRRVIVNTRNDKAGEGIAADIGGRVLQLLGADPFRGLEELSVRLANGNDVVEWRAVKPAPAISITVEPGRRTPAGHKPRAKKAGKKAAKRGAKSGAKSAA